MPSANAKVWRTFFADAPPQPGDEQVGQWTREKLQAMDEKFIKRLEQAIAAGREHPPGSDGKPSAIDERFAASWWRTL